MLYERTIMDEPALKAIVTTAIEKTLERYADREPPIVDTVWMGAIDLDPSHLKLWFLFEDGQALATAKFNAFCLEIEATLRRLLNEGGYPVTGMHIGFESKQAVDDAGGAWKYFR
jgi:hypothetical protein